MKWLIIYEITNKMLKTTSTILTVTIFSTLVNAQNDEYEYEEYDDGYDEYVEDDYY